MGPGVPYSVNLPASIVTIDNLIYIGRVPAGHRRGICRFPYDNLPSIGGWDIYATLNIDWASGSGRMNVRAIQKIVRFDETSLTHRTLRGIRDSEKSLTRRNVGRRL